MPLKAIKQSISRVEPQHIYNKLGSGEASSGINLTDTAHPY